MKRYIVRIKNPQVRDILVNTFEKVGNPKSLLNSIIVSTDLPKNHIEQIPGVVSVTEDLPITFSGTQTNPPNWALPVVCNDPFDYIYNKTGKDVDIYFVDKGIKESHIEFQGINSSRVQTIYSQSGGDVYYTNTHGTCCASQAAGNTCGVAKEANILNVVVWLDVTSYVLIALDRLLDHHLNKTNNNPSILSMSFNSTDPLFLKDEINDLVSHGIICVGSAGNETQSSAQAPACHDHVIGVGATDSSNTLCSFSNYGADVDILAPGYYNWCADLDGYSTTHYGSYYGTSFACPLVTGVLALIAEDRQINDITDVEVVTSILLTSARQVAVIPSNKPTTNKLLYSLPSVLSGNIYLGKNNQNIDISNSGAFVFGSGGYESINILSGVVGITIDGLVEQINFVGDISEYAFLQRDGKALIYRDTLLISIISVQSDTKLVFNEDHILSRVGWDLALDGTLLPKEQ